MEPNNLIAEDVVEEELTGDETWKTRGSAIESRISTFKVRPLYFC
jgi:hypothetical protein